MQYTIPGNSPFENLAGRGAIFVSVFVSFSGFFFALRYDVALGRGSRIRHAWHHETFL